MPESLREYIVSSSSDWSGRFDFPKEKPLSAGVASREEDGLIRGDSFEANRSQLADWLGVCSANLLILRSVREAMAAVPRCLGIGPSEQFLFSDREYPHLPGRWRALCRQAGAQHLEAAPDQLLKRATSQARWLCLSHVSAVTSEILPITEICREARRKGITTLIDGAQAIGQVPLDLLSLGADYYVGGLHKWFGLPYGAAFLYCRDTPPSQLRWLETGLGQDDSTFHLFAQGLEDFQGASAVARRAKSSQLAVLALELIPLDVLERKRRAPWMASFLLPDFLNASALKKALELRGTRVQILTFQGRLVLRLCFHPYNTEVRVGELAQVIREQLI